MADRQAVGGVEHLHGDALGVAGHGHQAGVAAVLDADMDHAADQGEIVCDGAAQLGSCPS